MYLSNGFRALPLRVPVCPLALPIPRYGQLCSSLTLVHDEHTYRGIPLWVLYYA